MADPDADVQNTVDRTELARFGGLGRHWWDPDGPFRPLHRSNPARLAFLRSRLCQHFGRPDRGYTPLAGLHILDAGCGGGLLAEPMARLGAAVTGADPDSQAIAAARAHAQRAGLTIDYRCQAPEELGAADAGGFDVVTAMEVVEHVSDVPAFTAALARLVRPGGAVVMSTLNRTRRSYWLAIVAAERILGWLPQGTHRWRRFLTPDELAAHLARAGLAEQARCGLIYDPLADQFRLKSGDMGVNYLMLASRPADSQATA